jgi:hypothetical protein
MNIKEEFIEVSKKLQLKAKYLNDQIAIISEQIIYNDIQNILKLNLSSKQYNKVELNYVREIEYEGQVINLINRKDNKYKALSDSIGTLANALVRHSESNNDKLSETIKQMGCEEKENYYDYLYHLYVTAFHLFNHFNREDLLKKLPL